MLWRCYWRCLERAKALGCKSIAFPCISAGVFHFPKRYACRIAVNAVRKWLELNGDVMRVLFCTYEDEDAELYNERLQTKEASQ